jgi:hypothetical protein
VPHLWIDKKRQYHGNPCEDLKKISETRYSVCIFSVITEVGNEVEEICCHDNARITAGILCQDFCKCVPHGTTTEPTYQVTRELLHARGKHGIEGHILDI